MAFEFDKNERKTGIMELSAQDLLLLDRHGMCLFLNF